MPAIKTVIYLDVLLLVNFLVAYFLLQAAGLLSSQHAAFSRMVCASGIASLSALILFAPELSYPAQILYKILTACAVVGVAVGRQGLRRPPARPGAGASVRAGRESSAAPEQ